MSTKAKSEIGAVIAIAGVPLVLYFVHDAQLAASLAGALGTLAGWLGFRKPGTVSV